MIVAMTKYSFLIYHKDYEAFLSDLRNLGMLHVVEKQTSANDDESGLQLKLQKVKLLEQKLQEMKRLLGGDFTNCKPECDESSDSIIERFDNLLAAKVSDAQKLSQLKKEIDRMQVWGEFNWKQIDALRSVGYNLMFYSVSSQKYNPEWEQLYNAFVISENGSQTFFVTVMNQTISTDNLIGAELLKLPTRSLSELNVDFADIESKIAVTDDNIRQLCADYYNTIDECYRQTIDAVNYDKVVINTEKQADDKLRLLEGWIPTAKEAEMNQFLESEGVYSVSKRATREDNAPVMLRNNKFSRLFHIITELYELPAYGSIDLTPFFAPFFVMFFGLCLGDAGYGVLLLITGLIARRKMSGSMKSVMTLVSILGVGTMVFGFMSGTLFGIELLKVDWPWIQKFKAVMLNSDQLFMFSLIIGGVQIIFGMFIKAISQTIRFGFKNALSAWGWLCAIVGCGGTFALQHFGFIDASIAKILYIVMGVLAALGIFVFNNVKRNPLINIGAGLWDSYNMVTGLLGDVLSYVRLFALGISGAVLGLVFNDLAMKMSPDIPVVGFLVSAVILLFGHAMNIFMSGLGAFVHPLRLTFVEFYKNAGFEGGGKKYKPFHFTKK